MSKPHHEAIARYQRAFSGGSKLSVMDRSGSFELQSLGEISLPTGRLVGFDPCGASLGLLGTSETCAFAAALPAGRFRIDLAVFKLDEAYNGFTQVSVLSRILFRDQEPTAFVPALFADQPADDDQMLGISVDTGFGCYASGEAFDRILKNEARCVELLARFTENHLVGGICALEQDLEVVCFSSGFGDGSYASLLGMRGGDIVCLVTDFGVAGATLIDSSADDEDDGGWGE